MIESEYELELIMAYVRLLSVKNDLTLNFFKADILHFYKISLEELWNNYNVPFSEGGIRSL